MKKIFTFIFVFILLTFLSNAQSIRVLTYNIRYNNAADSINRWDNRKYDLVQQIKNFTPDIFGIQEGLTEQVEFLKQQFTDFSFYGVGRDDGLTKGEFAGIFYNKQKFSLLKSGSFWLSQTPEKPSMGWDAVCIRICSYVLLEENDSKNKIWVFNTHFDHVGTKARMESAKLILKKIKELNPTNEALILMGDFNSGPESEAIEHISKNLLNTRFATKNILGKAKSSFNGFGAKDAVNEQIDFIFVNKNTLKTNIFLISDEKISENRYFSDHYPILVELEFITVRKK